MGQIKCLFFLESWYSGAFTILPQLKIVAWVKRKEKETLIVLSYISLFLSLESIYAYYSEIFLLEKAVGKQMYISQSLNTIKLKSLGTGVFQNSEVFIIWKVIQGLYQIIVLQCFSLKISVLGL